MKVNKVFLVLIIGVFVFLGRNTLFAINAENFISKDPKETIVSGIVKDGGNGKIIIAEIKFDGRHLPIDSAKTDATGKFSLKLSLKEIGFYQLQFIDSGKTESRKLLPLTMLPGDHIKIEVENSKDFDYIPKYSGTSWSEPINGLMKRLKAFVDWKRANSEDVVNSEDAAKKQLEAISNYVAAQIGADPANPANILLMTNIVPQDGFKGYNPKYITILEKMERAYASTYPNTKVAKIIQDNTSNLVEAYHQYMQHQVGQVAPDIALPNPQGDTMQLSDLRGKYVLLDFWASWCAPCRKENANVVATYKKYHNQGFTVYSVSLDRYKEKWEAAIKQDGLLWSTQVSDLKFWSSSAAATYGIQSIPHSFLIGPDGKIIAENLRGTALDKKLQEIFKNK